MEEILRKYRIPGVIVSVIENYTLKDCQSFGFRNVSKQEINSETLFQCASISKFITNLTVLSLAEKGKIDLEKEANNYLQDWKIKSHDRQCSKVKVRELLNHTGGISIHGFPGYAQGDKIPHLDQILKGEYPSNHDAIYQKYSAGIFRYSGGGTTIVQKILETICHQSFDEVVETYLFSPLKVHSASFARPRTSNYAMGYWSDKQPVYKGYHIYPEKAAAGLWCHIQGLSKIIIETQKTINKKSNALWSFNTIQKMFENTVPAREYFRAGMGNFIYKENGNKYFTHSGWNAGYRSIFVAEKCGGKGMIILVNSDNGIECIKYVLKQHGYSYLADIIE